MGKRAEQTKHKKLLEKEIVTEVLQQLKTGKWRKKYSSFSRECEGFFVCASLYLNINLEGETPRYDMTGRLEAKPMGVDPIFWDIAQMPENKKKAITFRAWAAFKTDPIYFKMNEPINKNVKTPDEVVRSFVQWATDESELVVKTLKQKPFSELLHQHLKERGAAA